jgi:hypothetical protein
LAVAQRLWPIKSCHAEHDEISFDIVTPCVNIRFRCKFACEGDTMKQLLWCAAILLTGLALPAHAVDRTFQTEVEKSLQNSVPDRWHLRASWRDKILVVFVSPPPEEMFKLWYAANEQLEMLQTLCRSVSTDVWRKIAPDQDIAMEEVVGGNGGKGSWRLSCRDVLAGRAPDGQPSHVTD